MKSILIIFIILTSLKVEAQKIVFDENIEVDSTEIGFKSDFINLTAFSSIDNKRADSLIVSLTSTNLVGYTIKLDFTQNLKPTLIIFSDANEFDGKHFMEIDIRNYELTLNKEKYNLNDKLMGYINGKTENFLIENQPYVVEFNGYFSHTVGKVLRKRHVDDSYDYYDPKQ